MSEGHTLRSRVPGQSVMSDVVESQRLVPERSRSARLFGRSPLTAENRVRFRGALGELLVGDALDHLGPEWDVLHAVPVDAKHYEIDHLAIGPSGVFTILTRNNPGQEVWVGGDTYLVGGHGEEHVSTARFEAQSAAALLEAAAGRPIAVEPVIVVVNPQKLTIKEQPDDVVVISSRQLVRWLSRLDRRLDGEEVAFISDVADRSATWHTKPTPALDTQQLHRDFAVLRSEVVSASRRRLIWASLAFVALCGVVWAGVASVVVNLIAQ